MEKPLLKLTPKPTGGESSSGPGLWITNGIAAGMDGEVYCRSELGRGSTFGLRLPAAGPATPDRSRVVFRDFRSKVPVAIPADDLALPA